MNEWEWRIIVEADENGNDGYELAHVFRTATGFKSQMPAQIHYWTLAELGDELERINDALFEPRLRRIVGSNGLPEIIEDAERT